MKLLTPVQGKSDAPGIAERIRCIESAGTSPQKPEDSSSGTLNDLFEAVAFKYISLRFSYPSTLMNAGIKTKSVISLKAQKIKFPHKKLPWVLNLSLIHI